MGAAFYQAHMLDPKFSSLGGSFIRVLANLAFIMIPIALGRGEWGQLLLKPGQHRVLWLWGLFGALTVTCFFGALSLIGNGLASFLSASSGVFVAALAPFIARQRTGPAIWIGVLGAVAGLYLLGRTTSLEVSPWGACLALLSGFFAAVAYLLVARTGSRYTPQTVMMTWCVAALSAHFIAFIASGVSFPASPLAWILLVAAGLAASLSMHFTTVAYQNAPAGLVASLSYLAPVLSLGLDAIFFGIRPGPQAGLGALLVVGFGAFLPFLRRT